MRNIELRIHLDSNNDGVYYTGDTITGKILIDVNEERFKLNGIKLIFTGAGKVSWSEKDNAKGNSKHSYTSYEEYTRCKLYILENITNNDMYLDVGHFEYDFEVSLLPNLPTSFEHTYGFIRYKLDAVLDVPWAFDVHCVKLISVINNVDLNTNPVLKESISASETKTFGFCCWCRSKPIVASVTLDKSGYCAGESIVFNASIQNNSSKEIKHATASLIQKVRFYARGKNKIVNREVCSVSYDKRIPPSAIEEWKDVRLKISSVAPTSNNQSQIIDISYFFVLSLVISGKSSDLDVIVPISIGTEPIKANSDLNSDISLNNHKKCIFGLPGRNEILIDNDGVQGPDAEFVPLYPYFKKTKS